MFKRIVVGCDGSDGSRDAVALGAALAETTGAPLSLLGVYPAALFPVTGVSDRSTLRRQTETMLRRMRDEFALEARIHTVVDWSYRRALRRFAEHWHAGAIVIGSGRDAARGHVAVSRRARQVLHDAPCAVAVAARGLSEESFALRAIGAVTTAGRNRPPRWPSRPCSRARATRDCSCGR